MSEYYSLYINIQISREKLNRFFEEKPLQLAPDENWKSWWNSREMHSKQPLERIPAYQKNSNRDIFDSLLKKKNFGSFERYDPASQRWTFVSVFFSENYVELLPMLALLKTLADCHGTEEKGVAFIYDFYWGNTSVMAYLDFSGTQTLLKNYTKAAEIDPEILNEANQLLETAVELLNKQFEDS